MKPTVARFEDLSINRKIGRSIFLTSVSALLISSVAIVGYELTSFRKNAMEELASLAEIVGANSTGALAFGDRAAATEILANLKDQTSIVGARIFGIDGAPFATYARAGVGQASLPEAPQPDQDSISNRHLRIFRAIRLRGDRVGTIFIESDMERVFDRLWRYAGIVFLVVLFLVPFVLLISARFQHAISNPIEELARVAHEIATNKTYSLRAPAAGADEVGRLTATFNQMLDTIEERDRKLVQQAEELWRSNKELEQFAYVSSHDLQEPLRKITTYAQLLESQHRSPLSEEGRKFLDNICVSATRMRTLITDLLTYSRLSRQDQIAEEIDLNRALKAVLNDMETVINDRKAVVTSDPLPTLSANAFQIQQLFQNLVGNALKFQGAEPPRVRISCRREGSEWLFGVHDNGIGIESRYAEQIFKVFQRLHGRDSYPGTGIGLAICRKIVEQQGGRIWVMSEGIGKGSNFYFTWPAESKAAEKTAE